MLEILGVIGGAVSFVVDCLKYVGKIAHKLLRKPRSEKSMVADAKRYLLESNCDQAQYKKNIAFAKKNCSVILKYCNTDDYTLISDVLRLGESEGTKADITTYNMIREMRRIGLVSLGKNENRFTEYVDLYPSLETSLNEMDFRFEKSIFTERMETSKIKAFLNDNSQFCWVGVVGKGGIGKSRLVRDIGESSEKVFGWKTVWMGENGLNRLLDMENYGYPYPLLVVIDDVGRLAEETGKLIVNINTFRRTIKNKIRIILIERAGTKETNSVRPYWHTKMVSDGRDEVDELNYCRNESPRYIRVNNLDEKACKKIIGDYLLVKRPNYEGKPYDLEDMKNRVYKLALDMEDGDAPRPLYLLMAVDARLNSIVDSRWDLESIATFLCNRMEGEWKKLCEDNESWLAEIERLKFLATMIGDLTEEKVAVLRENRLWNDAFWETITKVKELQIVNVINNDGVNRNTIMSIKPDILGEFFALRQMKRYMQADVNKEMNRIHNVILAFRSEFLLFLRNCLDDFCKEAYFSDVLQGELLLGMQSIVIGGDAELLNDILIVYAEAESKRDRVLSNRVCKIMEQQSVNASGATLEKFCEAYLVLMKSGNVGKDNRLLESIKNIYLSDSNNLTFRRAYIEALQWGFFTCDQDGIERNLNIAEELYQLDKTYQPISETYAGALSSASFFGSVESAKSRIARLEKVYQENHANEKVKEKYLCALRDLAQRQDGDDAWSTIELIRGELGESEKEKQTSYCLTALVAQAESKNERIADYALTEIRNWWSKHAEEKSASVAYATALAGAISVFPKEKAEKLIVQLERIHEESEECLASSYTVYTSGFLAGDPSKGADGTIRGAYAKGLAKIMTMQDATKRIDSLGKLKKLYKETPTRDYIARQYAGGILRMMEVTENAEAIDALVSDIHELYVYGNDNDLSPWVAEKMKNAVIPAYVASLLCAVKHTVDITKAEEYGAELERLYERYDSKFNIPLLFAEMLKCLSAKQELTEAKKSIEKLAGLYEKFPRFVFTKYGNALSTHLKRDSTINGRSEIVCQARRLYEYNKGGRKLYANGLVMLIKVQSERESRETLKELRKLVNDHENEIAMQEFLSAGLCEQIRKSNENNMEEFDDIIELSVRFFSEYIVLRNCAESFSIVLKRQSGEQARNTTNRFVKWYMDVVCNSQVVDREPIISLVAGSLNDLLKRQKGEEAIYTIEMLKKMLDDEPESISALEWYAAGLDQFCSNDFTAKSSTLHDELQRLYESCDNTFVLHAYSESLMNRIYNVSEKEARKNLGLITDLFKEHTTDSIIEQKLLRTAARLYCRERKSFKHFKCCAIICECSDYFSEVKHFYKLGTFIKCERMNK